MGEGSRLYYTGNSSRQDGVAITVSAKYRELVTKVTCVSNRLMAMKIEADDAELRGLNTLLRTFDAANYIFIRGDVNGQVGHAHDGIKWYHGGNGYGRKNVDEERILKAAKGHDLAFANIICQW
ncbi:unnamed protein product [Cylicostephanus goldi]|uniref:Endonuclease/exonuclease/phosphatase domain-containing protein n=1 Tax=Cylicostephanus goldi TaxID=71465 RepID=A0A3P7QAT9_CYLGO|nr:unnamed protein product [Cylicostephanus goldi]